MSEKRDLTIVINAKDNAGHTIGGLSDKTKGLSGDVFKANVAFEALSKAVKLSVDGLKAGVGVVKTWIQQAGKFELTAVALETMIGSAEKSKELLEDIVDFAKETPFRLEEVQEGVKMLLAMGASADTALNEMRMLGDVAAGLSVPLERIVLNFGQIRTQGKLTGKELRDFNTAGVPLVETLAKMNGVSREVIATMVEDGEITFQMVEDAFKQMTGEGGKFNNLMDKQSETFPGILSNIGDSFETLGKRVVGISENGDIREGSLFGRLKNAGQDFKEWIDLNEAAIVNMFQGFEDKGIEFGEKVADAFGWLKQKWDDFVRGFKGGWEAIGGQYILDNIRQALDALKDSFRRLGETIDKYPQLRKALDYLAENLGFIAGAGIGAIFNVIAGSIALVAESINNASGALDALMQKYEKFKNSRFNIAGQIQALPEWLSLPKRQHGGMIPGHPNQPVPAILHGGERIVSRTGVDAGGSSQGVTINFNGDLSVRSDQDITSLAQEISRILGRQAEFARIGVGA